MVTLEQCIEVALASGQPLRVKQPSVHLCPTQETHLPQHLLISRSLLSTVSSVVTLLIFLQRTFCLISSALGRALPRSPSAPEGIVGGGGVSKSWTSDLPSFFISRSCFWPRTSVLLSFSPALPTFPTQKWGPLEITAQLTQKQKVNIWGLVSQSLDLNPYKLGNLGQDTRYFIF